MTSQSLDVSVPHNLGKAEARRRIERGSADLQSRHGGGLASVEERWTGDRMDFAVAALGQRVHGWIQVQEHAVEVHVTLPWLLAKIAERLRPQIEGETRRILSLPPSAGANSRQSEPPRAAGADRRAATG